MTNTHHPGRNEPCPCGSGRKFKSCCQGKTALPQSAKRSPARYVAIAVAGIGLVMVLSKTGVGPSPAVQPENALKNVTRATLPGAGSGALTPQPLGPAPEGKVWSPEHGHWHDAAPQSVLGSAPPAAQTGVGSAALAPQPPGPAPEGKVWSPEHGHWHDAPTQTTSLPPP